MFPDICKEISVKTYQSKIPKSDIPIQHPSDLRFRLSVNPTRESSEASEIDLNVVRSFDNSWFVCKILRTKTKYWNAELSENSLYNCRTYGKEVRLGPCQRLTWSAGATAVGT